MKINRIGLGFVIGAIAGILINSIVTFDSHTAMMVIIITSIAGVAGGVLLEGKVK